MNAYDQLLAELPTAPKTWLITGVAGFIGSNLLETLLQLNQRVVGLDIDGTLTVGKKDGDSYETVRVSEPLKQRLIHLKSEEYWIILYGNRPQEPKV